MIAGSQPWKCGDILRNRERPPRIVYVVYVNKFFTLAVDLNDNSPTTIPFAILERNYDDWVKDLDVECKDHRGELEWVTAPSL